MHADGYAGFNDVFGKDKDEFQLSLDPCNTAIHNCTERRFWLSGGADLADQNQIHWQSVRCADLGGDRHTATGQGNDNGFSRIKLSKAAASCVPASERSLKM